MHDRLVSLYTRCGFPHEVTVRVWDAFLHEGPKVLYRLQLALLKTHQKVGGSVSKRGRPSSMISS